MRELCLTRQFQVPVIAVFTKYDQFLRNVEIDLEDDGIRDNSLFQEADRLFKEHYLRHLGEGARFVRLQSMCNVKCVGRVLIHSSKKCTNKKHLAKFSLRRQPKP